MRRILAAFLAFVIPLLVLSSAALALYRPGPPAEVQDRLDRYLALSRSQGTAYTVARTQSARSPEQLTRQGSDVTYGDGYFCTTYLDAPSEATAPLAAATSNPAGALQVSALSGYGCTDRALPYPSRAAWCAVLTGPGVAPRTVVVARHDNMYVARWVTHELRSQADACAICGCGAGQSGG